MVFLFAHLKARLALAIALAAVNTAVGTIFFDGRLKRQFGNCSSAIGAGKVQSRDVDHLAWTSIEVVHNWLIGSFVN
ncbi:MAG: hypothetical protein UX09_C0060G0006 [Candidatus Uhrbacteria bacterium GW2011_GWE2_45_35]|uniref:Uncharacterized protein n=2 Tax=Candidatus Uhriibacteriota TaxID=1752732 RepID=A0A0G1J9X8_9BACT|nr:MAG: hypothetical protein UW63_C0076G0006 [Candidatus Uhrbacteria bacterium GW2011_GWF2_44_350]KKU06071.1 MAG: hypothetical protein UX09_C0060G0006 [Candidatus Uhrbacteria bacterium GW2011_GWE2_45_35]